MSGFQLSGRKQGPSLLSEEPLSQALFVQLEFISRKVSENPSKRLRERDAKLRR